MKIEKKEKKLKKEEREQSKTRLKRVRFAAETENAPPASAANLSGLSLQLQVVPRRQSPREQLAHPPRGPSCRPVDDFYGDVRCAHTGFQRRSRDSRAGGREVSRRLCPNQPVDGAASRPLSLASPSSFLQRGRQGL